MHHDNAPWWGQRCLSILDTNQAQTSCGQLFSGVYLKAALTELVSQTRNAEGALKKQAATVKKGKKDTADKDKSSADNKASPGATGLFEFALEKGKPIPSVPFAGLQPNGLSQTPLIVTDVKIPDPASSIITSFGTKFETHALRDKPEGRGEQSLKGQELATAMDFSKSLVDPGATLPDTIFSSVKNMSPAAVFGIKGGVEMCTSERGRSFSLRVQSTGVREVIIVSAFTLKEYVVKKGLLSKATPEAVRKFFASASKETLSEFINAGNDVFAATVGPNTGLFVPFDSIWFERTKSGADIRGLRYSFFFKSDQKLVETVNRWMISSEAPSELVRAACEQYALLD